MSKKKNKTLMGGWIERGMSRPLALGVFALSALVLVLLELTSRHTLSVDGVGRASGISLSAPAIGFVSEVRVRQGQLVREGEVVLTIEAAEVRRQLDQVDADIRRTIREGRYEQARLTDELFDRRFERGARLAETRARSAAARAQALARREALSQLEGQVDAVRQQAGERLVPADQARSMELQLLEERVRTTEATALLRAELDQLHAMRDALPGDSSADLTRALVDLWEGELELLRVQREGLDRQLGQLTVRAPTSGRVVALLDPGAPVTIETTVARIVPEHATEVVAYLPPDTDRFAFADATRHVSVRAGGLECIGTLPVHAGGEVELAPGQLTTAFLGRPVYGLPLHITLPPDCHVGAGQLVQVSLVER